MQKYSLSGQDKELRDLVVRRVKQIYKIYIDQTSASKASRPGLDTLLDDMADGKFKEVLIVDQDRLSRLDPNHWELVKKQFRENGCVLVTPVGQVDFEDEDSELISDVFNLFARHQRRKLVKAMKRGRAH